MRRNKLIDRLSIAYKFVRYGKGNARIMTCEKCGSILIDPISDSPGECEIIDEERHIDKAWTEYVQCCKCGAVCKEVQFWNFDGDPLKIEKDLKIKKR